MARAASNDDNKAATSAIKAEAYDEGSDGDDAAASAARRAYAASVAADNGKPAASAVRRACTAIAALRTAEADGINNGAAHAAIAALQTAEADEIDNGTHNEGSLDNKAKASAKRRTYASAASNKDEALAPAARRVRTASASRGMAGGGYSIVGTSDEGSDDNKAAESAVRHAYASAASNEDEALASTAMRVHVARAARRTAGGSNINDGAFY